MTPTLRLAHSPDSDDMVMWWPLVGLDGGQPAIDTRGFSFALAARDVEDLNRIAAGRAGGEHASDITAISCAAYPLAAADYAITRCGGSFGEGYGPRVVVRASSAAALDDLRGRRIAVPGRLTTAFLTLRLMLGGDTFEPVEMLFSRIPDAVASGEVDAGLLIHEAQLTYGAIGLREVASCGVWWATQSDLPLPLGLNVVRRDLDERFGVGAVRTVAAVLAESVAYAVAHPADCRAHLRAHRGDRAEWDDDALLDRYLAMYVSALTLDMGERGRRAIETLLARGAEAGLCRPVGPIVLADAPGQS
jgi:1,4-dihydroxy-6-naphthoate synthase